MQAAGKHGLARARRADEQRIVAPSSGDLERALGLTLATHVLEVELARFGHDFAGLEERGLGERALGSQPSVDLAQRATGGQTQRLHHGGLTPVSERQATGQNGDGQRSRDASQLSGQGELSSEDAASQGFRIKVAGGGEHPQRDGQIEEGTLAAQIAWRQADGDALLRQGKVGVAQRGQHSHFGGLARILADPDDVEVGQTQREVDLDQHREGFEPYDGE